MYLRQLRESRGMRREELAAQLGISLTTVVNLETGRHEPRIGLAKKIAELFGVPLDSLDWGKPLSSTPDAE